jgi:REP element-mobilizing transposase RayT
MARPLRIEFPGALYHVTARGDGREDIYLDDGDRDQFLALLAHVVQRFHWRLHAYCLMNNHYHLLLETPEPNLSRSMRHLNGVYTQRFNRRHARVGHVFQGRFKAILVDKDSYLLELARYIVLNPVRARVTRKPHTYFWSSYRATAGLELPPAWLCIDWLLAQLAIQQSNAQERYRSFVEAGIGQPTVWSNLRQQIYLGEERFVQRMHKRLPEKDLSETPRAQRQRAPKALAVYAQGRDRNAAMVAAYRSGGYSLAAIARHFRVHYSTVSRVVRAAEEGAAKEA